MFHFENTAIWTSEFSQCVTPKQECCLIEKSLSSNDFQKFNHFKYLKMCLRARMLAPEWEGRALIEKVNRCFCWFPVAILVDSFCAPIWRLHTKLYKGEWNVCANNSETVSHKDLRFGQLVYILVLIIIFHFLGFFHWTVSNLFSCAVFIAWQWKRRILLPSSLWSLLMALIL